MTEELKELLHYRELLYMLAYRDIKVRYKQSIMGLMWAILMPVLIVGAGVVIRYAYAFASGKPLESGDIASVAVKSLPWAFLVSSIRFSCTSLTNNQNLVTKVYFPKEVFPIAAVMASLFDFLVASGALVIFLLDHSCRVECATRLGPVAAGADGGSGCGHRNACFRCKPFFP